jgi:hypothetical protein
MAHRRRRRGWSRSRALRRRAWRSATGSGGPTSRWVMDNRLDDRRRLLQRRGGHGYRCGRSRCSGGRGFTREVSRRKVREEPGQSECARGPAECGQATDENCSVPCGLLWRFVHRTPQSSCGVGLGDECSGGLGLAFGLGEVAGGCGAGFDFWAGGGGS